MLKSIDDCSPADLLEALKKIRNDEVEVEQIREMMVPVQSIRGKLEVEMKRLEGLGICADVGEEVSGKETLVSCIYLSDTGRRITHFKLSFMS